MDQESGGGGDSDDLTQGAEPHVDDDFGDFDDGYEEPASSHEAQSASEAPLPSFVSRYFRYATPIKFLCPISTNSKLTCSI